MFEYERMAARQRKWMLYLLAILVLGAVFTPYLTTFLGLLLGSIVSFYNLYLLQKKTADFMEAAAKKLPTKGLGIVSRFAAVVLVILVALRYEDHVNVIAVLIGLMTSYLVIMLDFIVFQRKSNAEERGE